MKYLPLEVHSKGNTFSPYIQIILMTMCLIYTDDVSDIRKTPLAKLEGLFEYLKQIIINEQKNKQVIRTGFEPVFYIYSNLIAASINNALPPGDGIRMLNP